MSLDLKTVLETKEETYNFVVIIVPADDLALLGARASAGTVITKCGSYKLNQRLGG